MAPSKGDKSMKALKRGNSENSSEREESHSRREASSLRERNKRPDKQLYVPRALRGQSKRLPIQKEEDLDKKGPLCNPSNKQDLCPQSSTKSFADCSSSFPSGIKCDSQPLDDSKMRLLESTGSEESNSCSIGNADTKSITSSDTALAYLEPKNTTLLEKEKLLDVSQAFVLNHPICCQSSTEVDTSNKTVNDNVVSSVVNDALEHEYQDSKTKSSANSSINDHKSENFEEPTLNNCDKTVGKTSDLVKPSVKDEEHGDSWETMFNDDGECLNPDFVKDLSNVVGRIQICVAENNYSEYQPSSDCSSAGYDNIVELYNFPKEFSTQDLVSALSFFEQSSYTIKWVDDCHALALFSSPAIVNQALQLNHPFVKVRPLSEGIKESKLKARWFASNCEPSKPRPATSAVLARRLVSGALGLKVQTTKEQREMERTLLKEAKEKRKLKAKQRQDIWDGLVQ